MRYAETNGYERDGNKPQIWRYRDYVIDSFNQNKPYDRMVLEHIAGDELPDADAASITATGYQRLGVWDDEPADRKLARYDYLDDIVRTSGEVFLGMTIGCARCHDHKIDPISAKDYYSMLSFFANVTPHRQAQSNMVQVTSETPDPQALQTRRNWENRRNQIQKSVQSLKSEFFAKLDPKHLPKPNLNLSDARAGGLVWKYSLTNPGDAWETNGFGDAQWQVGKSGFGSERHPWLDRQYRVEDQRYLAASQIRAGGVAQVSFSLLSSRRGHHRVSEWAADFASHRIFHLLPDRGCHKVCYSSPADWAECTRCPCEANHWWAVF